MCASCPPRIPRLDQRVQGRGHEYGFEQVEFNGALDGFHNRRAEEVRCTY